MILKSALEQLEQVIREELDYFPRSYRKKGRIIECVSLWQEIPHENREICNVLFREMQDRLGVEIMTQICQRAGCGKKFTPRRAWQRFCSEACGTMYHTDLTKRSRKAFAKTGSPTQMVSLLDECRSLLEDVKGEIGVTHHASLDDMIEKINKVIGNS